MRTLAIVGVAIFGLAGTALAIVGLWLTASGMSCPSCGHAPVINSHATLCFVGGGACAVMTVICGVMMRRRAATAAKTTKLGLR